MTYPIVIQDFLKKCVSMYLKFMISFVEKPSADVSFGFKTIKT